MKKNLLILILILTAFSLTDLSAVPQVNTGRTWEYLSFTALLSPSLALVVMPGHRYEFYRSTHLKKSTFLWEFFLGPTYITKLSDSLKLKIGLWYYYLAFPDSIKNTYFLTHNIELLPILEYKTGSFLFVNRIILHNTLYANVYPKESDQTGLSTVLRELIGVNYSVSPKLTLSLEEEIFLGIIENKDVPASGAGFAQKGFSENRVYLGFTCSFTPFLSLSPKYCLDTTYNTDGNLTGTNHYLFVTLAYTLKFF